MAEEVKIINDSMTCLANKVFNTRFKIRMPIYSVNLSP